MPWLDTSTLSASALASLDSHTRLQLYCALDSQITCEVHSRVEPGLDPYARLVYDFERALRAPALDMMLRGVRVDMGERQRAIGRLEHELGQLLGIIHRLAMVLQGRPLNPASPAQLTELFYNRLGCQPVWQIERGERRLTVGKAARAKIAERHPWLRHLVRLIDLASAHAKLIGALRFRIDNDCRLRCSMNIGATETGRWSSSKGAFGGGFNAQNVTEYIRRVFVSDEGMKFAYIDLKSAESICTGYVARDEAYIQACQGDIHTEVARRLWPNLEWGPDPDSWRKVAEAPYYEHHSYRDMAKRGGHASNYGGQPATLARHLHIPLEVAEDFQLAYFDAFPGIRAYHHEVAQLLHTTGQIITPFGRKRQFLGRLWDDATLREAIAYVPQSMTADALNLGMYRLWERWGTTAQLLLQVHDAVLVQYPEHLEDRLLPEFISSLEVDVPVAGRTMRIPADAKTGWNWAEVDPERRLYDDGNPDGLKSYKGPDSRRRQRSVSDSLSDYRTLPEMPSALAEAVNAA